VDIDIFVTDNIGYKTLNDRANLNDELKEMSKEVVEAYFKVLCSVYLE
jgi:hypothetical protein